MSEINLKLKSYDELIFEITTLNTNKYLLEQKLNKQRKIIDKAVSMLELSGGREKISKDFVNIGRKRYDEIIKVLKGE